DSILWLGQQRLPTFARVCNLVQVNWHRTSLSSRFHDPRNSTPSALCCPDLLLTAIELLCSSQTTGTKGAIIKPVQALDHLRRQQRKVTNRKQVFCDEPDRLRSSHPVPLIEARKVHRVGKTTQGPLPAQVEIYFEITQGQFPKGAVHRFAV